MLYNTGDIDDWDEENSILSIEDLRRYIAGAPKHYPLPLDVALPIFSWGLVYRSGDFWKILTGLQAAELRQDNKFRPISANRFEVLERTLRCGLYLLPGDQVRLESISPASLLEAAGLTRQIDLADDATMAFFNLDTLSLRRFPVGTLQKILER